MASPVPVQPTLKESQYESELSSFGDINNLFKFFMTKQLRSSLSSPPLAKDVEELGLVFDKTLLRVYTKVDGVLKFVQFS